MKYGRIVLATVVITVLNFLYGWLTCGWLFKWVYALAPTNVWVPESAMTGSFFVWMFLGHLVLSFFFVLVFARLYGCMPGADRGLKGVVYGLFVWLVGVLPGMFATSLFMTVNKVVIVYWTLSGFIWLMIAGLVSGWIVGERGESKRGCCCC
jgi:hypothetical protein